MRPYPLNIIDMWSAVMPTRTLLPKKVRKRYPTTYGRTYELTFLGRLYLKITGRVPEYEGDE